MTRGLEEAETPSYVISAIAVPSEGLMAARAPRKHGRCMQRNTLKRCVLPY